FSRRRRHTRLVSDWSSDVCSSDLVDPADVIAPDDEDVRLLARLGGLRLDILVVRRQGNQLPLAHALGTAGRVGTAAGLSRLRCQIGRASCRERGACWGAAGSVKDE